MTSQNNTKTHTGSLYHIVVTKTQTNFLLYIQKRGFFRLKLYYSEPKYLYNTRSMTTWNACTRIGEAKYGKYPPVEVDPETGLEIMNAHDYSGKNHYLLTDIDYQSDKFYKIYGSFSTSSTFFNNKPPLMVSGFTLEGHVKKQFFHHYDIPKLIRKNDVELNDLATHALSFKEFSEFLNTLPT